MNQDILVRISLWGSGKTIYGHGYVTTNTDIDNKGNVIKNTIFKGFNEPEKIVKNEQIGIIEQSDLNELKEFLKNYFIDKTLKSCSSMDGGYNIIINYEENLLEFKDPMLEEFEDLLKMLNSKIDELIKINK